MTIDLCCWRTPKVDTIQIQLRECALPLLMHAVDIGAGNQFSPGILEDPYCCITVQRQAREFCWILAPAGQVRSRQRAPVAKLVDARDLKSLDESHTGSIPVGCTKVNQNWR